jgi:hypothetical protein
MDKRIFTIVEDDLQEIALEKFGRKLTPEEIRIAIKNFEYGIPWHEVAEVAVDFAVEEHG